MRFGSVAIALAIALTLDGRGAGANPQDFANWLDGFKAEARASGISEATLQLALAGVEPLPRVIELDRRQPEFTLRFEEYLARIVSEERVRTGQRLLRENAQLLDQVAMRFGVAPRFIIALWGAESDYGKLTGDFNVVAALATLAYDGRRSAFFRKELLNALRIVEEGHVSPATMTGSWAGAMGQNQFMPSSYIDFAVDFDGDGRRDIWSNRADVFASIANYLSRSGWRGDEGWGRHVKVPPGFDQNLITPDLRKPVSEWSMLGVTRADGGALEPHPSPVSLVQPAGRGGAVYMVFDNYRTILRWNRSLYFATAVGHLADRLDGS